MKQTCLQLTRCSWQDTNVWKPGATPNPSWSMKGGSSWLWICTLIPASKDVSSTAQRDRKHGKSKWDGPPIPRDIKRDIPRTSTRQEARCWSYRGMESRFSRSSQHTPAIVSPVLGINNLSGPFGSLFWVLSQNECQDRWNQLQTFIYQQMEALAAWIFL